MRAPNYPHPIIAREGWPFLGTAVVIALLLSVAGLWIVAALAWVVVLFITQFFRDPPRVVPEAGYAVLAPADGRIVSIDRVADPLLARQALRISVFMNVFNVHSNRSPVDGTVVDVRYHAGSFFNAELAKASLENERNAVHLRTSDGADVVCVQIAGLIARRILCYVGPGDVLRRGQRFGFIRFGSRVDVYLDPSASPRVAVGDVVFATSTIIAERRA